MIKSKNLPNFYYGTVPFVFFFSKKCEYDVRTIVDTASKTPSVSKSFTFTLKNSNQNLII